MEYKGKLYGRIGQNTYFPLGQTSDDVDKQADEINRLKDEVEYLKGVIKQIERDAAREIDKRQSKSKE